MIPSRSFLTEYEDDIAGRLRSTPPIPRYHLVCRNCTDKAATTTYSRAVTGPPVRFYWGAGHLFFRRLAGDSRVNAALQQSVPSVNRLPPLGWLDRALGVSRIQRPAMKAALRRRQHQGTLDVYPA